MTFSYRQQLAELSKITLENHRKSIEWKFTAELMGSAKAEPECRNAWPIVDLKRGITSTRRSFQRDWHLVCGEVLAANIQLSLKNPLGCRDTLEASSFKCGIN